MYVYFEMHINQMRNYYNSIDHWQQNFSKRIFKSIQESSNIQKYSEEIIMHNKIEKLKFIHIMKMRSFKVYTTERQTTY